MTVLQSICTSKFVHILIIQSHLSLSHFLFKGSVLVNDRTSTIIPSTCICELKQEGIRLYKHLFCNSFLCRSIYMLPLLSPTVIFTVSEQRTHSPTMTGTKVFHLVYCLTFHLHSVWCPPPPSFMAEKAGHPNVCSCDMCSKLT